jgi:hypothetical protein
MNDDGSGKDRTSSGSVVKWYANRFDRFLIWSMIVAFALSLGTTCGHFDGLGGSWIVREVSNIVPAVERVSNLTTYASTARGTIAVQWLFAPLYLLALCLYRSPWMSDRATDIASRRDIKTRAMATLPGILICVWFILADWKIIVGPSFLLGNVWEPTLSLGRLPYTGRLGLATSSFLSPCAEAMIYWLVPSAIFRQYVPAFRAVRQKSTSYDD